MCTINNIEVLEGSGFALNWDVPFIDIFTPMEEIVSYIKNDVKTIGDIMIKEMLA